MYKKNVAPLVAGALLVAASSAMAATKTQTITVSATVAGNCVVGAQSVNFGSYDGSAALTGSGDVTVRCSNGTPYSVLLSSGSGTYAERLLGNGGSRTLQYNLYTTSAFTTVWGDGSAATGTVGGTGSGMSSSQVKTHTIYGQLPNSAANQDAPAGAYSDSVVVTVSY
jgi:spore coat protein U-like protein